ncbi:MAG TPA: chemotaxis protein [Clostridium sp.]|nr:chemotaxis protein [Clostridium sp.]
MRQEKLEQIIEGIKITNGLVTKEMGISIFDLDGTVIYVSKPKSMPGNFEKGYKHEDKNDAIFKVMATGKPMFSEVPKELFGVAMEGNVLPVYDEGKIVGCVASAIIKSQEEEFVKKNKVIEEIHQSINKLEDSVSGVYGVVESIKKNTSSIKMLALNASIEAARAGEYGRGFTIVAHEMGKLSQMSSESVEGINDTLNDITKSIRETT